MHNFLDETGNFKGDEDGLFLVGGFTTGDPRRTAKAFRKWQHTKFTNKKLRYRTEVKFSDTRLNDDLRAKTLFYFTKQDIRIFYTFLKRENIPLEFRKGKRIETGRLYTKIIAETLGLLFPTADPEFRIFLDRRALKSVTQAEFKEMLRLDLLAKLPAKALLQIETVDSTTSPNIQIADWICGALYRYHTNRHNGKKFFDIIYNNITVSKELFKNYWQNLYKYKNDKKQKTPHKS